MVRQLRRMIVALVITGVFVTGVGVALAATFRVNATTNKTWKPAHRYITKGDVIRWRNASGRKHTIRSYGGNWSYSVGLPNGSTRSRRFGRVGTFRYRCTLHSTVSSGACSGMCGIVHVFSG